MASSASPPKNPNSNPKIPSQKPSHPTPVGSPKKPATRLKSNPATPSPSLGFNLKVAGFFLQEDFTRLRCLTGDPLAPIDPSGQKTTSGNTSASAQAQYHFLSPISTAIVPARMTQQLDARLMSIAFRPIGHGLPAQKSEALAISLAQLLPPPPSTLPPAPASSPSTPPNPRAPQDLSTVIVPIIIAGIIVLNTMLGAVSERTREIHVYTSVGLSPIHVGMLFLAEAAALGTLGIVFGYIFGQGLATLLSWTHLLPGVDLNYSSTSAITTMAIVLAIVMLSSLWPAHAASRLAAPSLQRDWKLPRPVGDLLLVDLPFTVNESAARGTLAFIAEFLATTSNAGTGKFTADEIAGSAAAGTRGITRTLSAKIWLAPFDLGVIQTMQLSIHPTDQPHVFDVHLALTREAGNPSTWHRLNRPFLTEIRRQFLLWRALDSQRCTYVRRFCRSIQVTHRQAQLPITIYQLLPLHSSSCPSPPPSRRHPLSKPGALANFAVPLFFSLFAIAMALFSTGFLEADEITHFLYARAIWHDPYALVSIWGRMGCSALFGLAAPFGILPARLLAVAITLLTAYGTATLLKHFTTQDSGHKTPDWLRRHATALAWLLFFAQPCVLLNSFTVMTEMLLACCWVWAAVIAAKFDNRRGLLFAGFILGIGGIMRPEGWLAIAAWPLWAAAYRTSHSKNFRKEIPTILASTFLAGIWPLAWFLIGAHVWNDWNWVRRAWPGNCGAHSPYDTTALLFLLSSLAALAFWMWIPVVFAAIAFWRNRSRQALALLVVPVIAFFLMHGILGSAGLFGSFSLPRYFQAVAPMIAILAAFGISRFGPRPYAGAYPCPSYLLFYWHRSGCSPCRP